MKDNFNIEYDLTLFDDGRIVGVVTHVCCGTYTTKEGVLHSYHDNKDFAFYLKKDANKDFCNDDKSLKCGDFKYEGNLVGTSTLRGTWGTFVTSQVSYKYPNGTFVMTPVASTGGAYGKVTDLITGLGIPEVLILLKDRENVADYDTTDSNGEYKLQNVWVGKEYTLVVSANDYEEQLLSCKIDKAEKDRGKEYNFSLKEKYPIVISTSPRDGAKDIPLTAVITATFSEPMDSSTINDATFLLNSKEGLRRKSKNSRGKRRKSVTGVVTYNDAKKMAIFTPASSSAIIQPMRPLLQRCKGYNRK